MTKICEILYPQNNIVVLIVKLNTDDLLSFHYILGA